MRKVEIKCPHCGAIIIGKVYGIIENEVVVSGESAQEKPNNSNGLDKNGKSVETEGARVEVI
jgi:hypothetical protein